MPKRRPAFSRRRARAGPPTGGPWLKTTTSTTTQSGRRCAATLPGGPIFRLSGPRPFSGMLVITPMAIPVLSKRSTLFLTPLVAEAPMARKSASVRRQRARYQAWRARQKRGAAVYPVEVDSTTFDLMERFGGLEADKVDDKRALLPPSLRSSSVKNLKAIEWAG